ncbi:hypothetical protein QQ045_005182 [Rhodiola kirilowii]
MMTSTSTYARAAYLNPILPFYHLSTHSPLAFTAAPRLRSNRYRFLRVNTTHQFDYEFKFSRQINSAPKLKIAIIGFGNYGQFLAKTLIRQDHTVLAHSRSDYSDVAICSVAVSCGIRVAVSVSVSVLHSLHDVCEQQPDVVLLCTSILSFENVVNSLPLRRFKRNTLFVDVHIQCLSAKDGWSGLTFVYEKVRIGNEESRVSRCEKFLDIFEREGILRNLELEPTEIDTKGYESLLDLVENTAGDSFDLYYGLFMYNPNAVLQLKRLDLGFEALRKQLFEHVHGILRKQLFGSSDNGGPVEKKVQLLPENATVSGGSVNDHALAKVTKPLRPTDIFSLASYKTLFSNNLDECEKLKIAVVGFGNFGQFIAKTMVRQGHHVLAYSRSNYMNVAQEMGATFYSNADDLCEQHPDVVFLCSSILSTEKVLVSATPKIEEKYFVC